MVLYVCVQIVPVPSLSAPTAGVSPWPGSATERTIVMTVRRRPTAVSSPFLLALLVLLCWIHVQALF